MKIKNPETGEVIVIPQGMEDAVRDAIESGNDPMEAMQMKHGGIHINPANKGKFNATKKATGKTTEELTHSKNPLTRKRAIFAQNASRWKHQDGGQAMQQQQPQEGGQEDQMQQLIQMVEQALAQGASPEEVAQMLIQQGVPEQVVQQVIQYAIQDLQQQQQAQGQNPEEQMQQQNPQEEQAEMGYGGMSMYDDGGMAMYSHGGMGMYEEGGMSMYGNGGQLPESLLRTRMKASGATSEEINNYLTENYNYGGMTMYGHGGMIKRADGSYSKRGLWDNIRANKGSGKAPTKEMLEQESKIRAREAAYGGAYGNGGGIDNPGFRALPAYVQQDIINNMAYGGCMECGGKMETGGRFLRKAVFGVYDDNSSYRDNPNDPNSAAYNNFTATNAGQPNQYQEEVQMDKMPLTSIQSGSTGNNLYGYDKANPLPSNMDKVNPVYPMQYHGKNYDTSTPSKTNNKNSYNYNSPSVGGSGYFSRGINNLNSAANSFIKGSQIKRHGGLHRMDPGGLALSNTSSNATWGQGLGNLGTGTSFTSPPPTAPIDGFQMDPNQIQDPNQAQEQLPLDNTVLPQNEASSQKPNGMYKWAAGIGKAFSNNNVNYGKGALKATKGLEDLSKGAVEIFGNNISNRNALGDEANNLRSAMRNDYQKVGKRPTDGNAIISKYGGRMMQDGGATYADKMKVSKNSPEADFIAEKGEYIVNNGVASKLETGGSHASGNDTAISLDKSSNPSYVLSDTPRLKQLQFGGKRVSPSKYAEMATVEALGKTPDQILKAYTSFTKRAGTEGKVFGDRISDATNQLLGQKYQKDLATVKQIADQAYHKQEQLKHAMGMDNDLDHAQEVNGMSMAKSGGMQDGVHMNYFNAPAVQYGGSPQLFSDPSELGYNTTQMAYGGLHKMQNAGNANPYSNWKGQTFSTPEGRITPEKVDLNIKPMADWAGAAQRYAGKDSRITTKQTPEAIGALQEVIYDEYLDTPQGQEALNKMWLEYGVTNQLEKNYSGIANKIKNKEKLTLDDLKLLRANYIDKNAGKRLPERLSDAPVTGTTETTTTTTKDKDQEVDKKKLDIETADKKANYDIPAINAYIPQSYGRNPIGLQLAQAQTIRPAKLNIQSELNEYNRGMRGALRGTQGNTSVNVAQQMQGLNNLYGAQNKLFGQKYNFDEQSRAGADQFNAQAIMNTDAANIQRIGVNQDAIARREGAIDTQRRTDFQAGIENADKQNAYGLSKDYIESTFGPYLNNEGKLNFAYDPDTGEKINKDKEKSYTMAQINKMKDLTDMQKKELGYVKYGGSLKKIKLKLRK